MEDLTRDPDRDKLPTFGILLLYLWVCCAVMYLLVVRNGWNYQFADNAQSWIQILSGNAPRPFATRALMPMAVRAISAVSPEWFKNKLAATIHARKLPKMINWDTRYDYLLFISLVIVFWLLFGLCLVFRQSVRFFYSLDASAADILPVCGLLMVPLFFVTSSIAVYDPLSIFLFALALLAIGSGKDFLFYVVFLLGTLNKETSIFLVLVFFLRKYEDGPIRNALIHGLIQTMCWLTIIAIVNYAFKDLPGSLFWWNLPHNLNLLFSEPPDHLICLALAYAGLCYLVFRGWERKPKFLRNALVVAGIPFFIANCLFGSLAEMRPFYEFLPLLFLLAVPTWVHFNRTQ
jgi:hypothetical protein